MNTFNRRSYTPALGAGLGALLLLGACGAADESESAAGSDVGETESVISIDDPWVKAADEGMSAAFGTISNTSDSEITITASDTGVSSAMELHEMTSGDGGEMTMREKDGGIVIPAGGEHQLDPGGDHLMLMDLNEPIEPGQDISITLTFDDGGKYTFDAPVRTFDGANEEYEGDMDMGDLDMETGSEMEMETEEP